MILYGFCHTLAIYPCCFVLHPLLTLLFPYGKIREKGKGVVPMLKGVRVYHNPNFYRHALHDPEVGVGNLRGQWYSSQLVAIVRETVDFEEAFELTNHIHSSWCGEDRDSKVVVYNGNSHRSTSVGDFMISFDFSLPDGEKFSDVFMVDSVGFVNVGKLD